MRQPEEDFSFKCLIDAIIEANEHMYGTLTVDKYVFYRKNRNPDMPCKSTIVRRLGFNRAKKLAGLRVNKKTATPMFCRDCSELGNCDSRSLSDCDYFGSEDAQFYFNMLENKGGAIYD